MCLQAENEYTIPEETVRVARAAFPRGNAYVQMRDELGILYEDQAFRVLFSRTGQPGIAPWRLMLITIMQYMEGLTDRQAAAAVGSRIDWKYVLSLELTASSFDSSVLSEFRTRLVDGSAETYILDELLRRFQEQGLLKARGRQRSDSTHVLAAIRVMDRLELVGETLRATLNSMASIAPDWLRAEISLTWFDRYSSRVENYHLPKDPAQREALAAQIGSDGFQLLSAVYNPQSPDWLRHVPAVQILRRVWLQQYYAPQPDCPVRWRESKDAPSPGKLIHSPYDTQARYATKHNLHWVGYKVHLTETCDADCPHLITHVETTLSTVPDYAVTDTIHQALDAKDLLPSQHVLDGGYVDAQNLVNSQQLDIQLISPVRSDCSWQAHAAQGFDVAHFAIDWDQHQATCPQGQVSTKWQPALNRMGEDIIHVQFAKAACLVCPLRAACTKAVSEPRELTLFP